MTARLPNVTLVVEIEIEHHDIGDLYGSWRDRHPTDLGPTINQYIDAAIPPGMRTMQTDSGPRAIRVLVTTAENKHGDDRGARP